ncbi:MAG: G8 domain-containing protein [Candidatus Hydrogenedentota bacterium]
MHYSDARALSLVCRQVFLYGLALFVTLIQVGAHAATATQSGDWSNGATWGGSVPTGTEEDIVIPSGIDLLLDQNVECGELKVMGTLTVDAADLSLTCDSLIVMGATAEFTAGTDVSRFTNRFVLTLKGESSENFEHTMGSDTHDMGARALVALMGGTINIHGEDRNYEWTHLDATVSAGATQLTLSDAVDWEAGDVIVITASTSDWTEVETVTISSVANGGLTVNISSPLANDHLGVIYQYTRPSDSKDWYADIRAEVGLLSRNVTIQGAADSTTDGFGAHVMIHGPMVDGETTHPSGEGYIKGVEIYRGGQKSLLARYPFHWHLLQDSGSGQYFSDNAVHESFNRGITIHGTDYTTVENNIFYNHIGHGVFLEDGSEFYNTIRYNLVALTKRPAQGEEVTPSDNSHDEAQNRTPASYWITNPNNTFEYNVAAGSEGTGYWFIFPTQVIGLAAGLTYYTDRIADEQPLGSFLGNTAHSNMNGFDIFDRLGSDHSIIKNSGWIEYSDHVFDQNTWYANDTALYAGDGGQFQGNPTQNIIHRDSVFIDNHHTFMLASSNVIEESLIVADSSENLADYPRYFWRVYDGAPSLVDSYLVGWDASDTNFVESIGAAHKRVNWRHSGIETDHVGVVRMELEDYDIAPTAYAFKRDHPQFFGNILRDVDGTLTGTANTSVVANHPWLLVGDETLLPNATNVYHSPHKFARITDWKENYPDVFFTRTNPGTKTEYLYASNGEDKKHQIAAIVNEDFLYTVNYTALPATSPVTWYLREAEEDDVALIRIPNTGGLTGLSVSGTTYTSVAEIYSASSTTTGYFLDGDGTLWIRFVADSDGRASVSISGTGGSMAYVYNGADDSDKDGMSNDTEGGPSLDTDGDGVPDYLDANSDGDGLSDEDEVYYGLDPHSAADLRYEFGSLGTGGWQEGGTADSMDVDVAGAMEVVNGNGNDPHIALAYEDIIGFPGNDVSTLRVRYKANASGTLNLFWANTLGGFSALRRLSATTSYTANSGYQEAVFNVGLHSEWANKQITGMRLDTLDSAPNSTVYVDWIRAGTQTELSSSGPTYIVYVDFGHGGLEDGSSSYPWNLLEEALDVVDTDGLINITKGSGHNESAETFSGGGTISQQVTIDAIGGLVRIGAP